jgi:hypothetical protein
MASMETTGTTAITERAPAMVGAVGKGGTVITVRAAAVRAVASAVRLASAWVGPVAAVHAGVVGRHAAATSARRRCCC